MGDFEILEHTADVGLLARAATANGVFETATRGLADLAGIWRAGDGEEIVIEVEARDHQGLLVGWLSEVLYLHDARNLALTSVVIDDLSSTHIRGRVGTRSLTESDETGIGIKAVTYHQLAVCETSEGWRATVFFDI